jgi:hypothetical protein
MRFLKEETVVILVDTERAEDLLSAFKFNKGRNEKMEYIAIRARCIPQMAQNRTYNELNTHR